VSWLARPFSSLRKPRRKVLDFAHCSAREAKVGFRKSALNPTLRFEALV
jgi:hypothetical protein